MTASTTDSAPRSIDDVLTGDGYIAMVMTMIGDEHTSRPVTCLEIDDGRLSFIVNTSFDWVAAIQRGDAIVHVTIADENDNNYVAVNGTATITTSQPEIERLWNPVVEAWFEGAGDPNIGVLHFEVASGEWWDGPSGRVGQAVGILTAIVTGDDSSVGNKGSVVAGGA